MPQTRTRQAGSSRTILYWNGHRIAWLDRFTDSGKAPIAGPGGQAYEVIQPLGKTNPQEVHTSRIMGTGTLTISVRELWNEEWWEQFRGLRGTKNLVDVWRIIAQRSNHITCAIRIMNPRGPDRGKIFHGVVPIPPFDDGTTGGEVTIGSLTVPRQMTALYLRRDPLNGEKRKYTASEADQLSADATWVPEPNEYDEEFIEAP